MRMDAVCHPVVRRAQAQAAFELTPCPLDTLQLLMAQGHVRSAQGIVVAVPCPGAPGWSVLAAPIDTRTESP